MMAQEEWDWIVEHAHGTFDHVVLASSLPVFLPVGIHHLEAWNEAMCDGAWGGLVQRLGERLRRAVDLEHWAAYQLSFGRLVDLLRSISVGLDGRPPASITHPQWGRAHDVRGGRRPRRSIGQRARAPDRLLAVSQPLEGARAPDREDDGVTGGRESLLALGSTRRRRADGGLVETRG